MDNVTIISYPGARDDSLLSLTQDRSRYMLPFGGKFRVVDFTLRNSFSAKARSTIIYSNQDDGLEDYVERYGPFRDMKFPPIKIVTHDYSDINTCYKLILDSNTRYYIIYNGDNPSIIDFHGILEKYRASRSKSLLFLLSVGERATMAYKVLIIDQKTLLKVVNRAIDEKRTSPNIYEMIINIMINNGIKKSTLKAHYWPIRNIPDYFNLHREVIWNQEIFNLLFQERIIQSKINAEGYASIGPGGKVARSFMSDYCYINGTVENSIIYPGVKIEEGSVVRDSIILPFVKIGSGVRIYRSIIDERTDNRPENIFNNIDNSCKVGSEDGPIKNSDFPQSLFNGITLIGKNCRVHNEAKIGGGCFVASGLGEKYFSQKKYLYDGTSLVK